METIELSTGYELKLARASFKDAWALKDLVLKKIKVSRVSLKGIKLDKMEEVLSKDVDEDIFKTIIQEIMTIEADNELTDAIFKCAKKSTINKEKITKQMFEENFEMWELVIPLKIEVLRYNVMPFFKGLQSTFNRIMQ